MTFSTLLLAAASAAAMTASVATGATLSIVGGTSVASVHGYNPTPHVPLTLPLVDIRSATDGGLVDGGLHLALGAHQRARVSYTVVGQESGFFNTLLAAGTSLTETQLGHSILAEATTSGFLDFGFRSAGYDPVRDIRNGGLSHDKDFYIGLGQVMAMGLNDWSLYAYFGDGTGDRDHDDLVARIDVSAVPVPASALLLSSALLAAAALGRRKRG